MKLLAIFLIPSVHGKPLLVDEEDEEDRNVICTITRNAVSVIMYV